MVVPKDVGSREIYKAITFSAFFSPLVFSLSRRFSLEELRSSDLSRLPYDVWYIHAGNIIYVVRILKWTYSVLAPRAETALDWPRH